MSPKKRVSSLENALHILKLFTMDQPELSVTAIAKKLQVAKSTAHRLLSSLAAEGFVYKDPHSNLYSLGASILSMVNIVNSQIHIANEAIPILNLLVERSGENAHLAILEGLEVVYLQTITGIYSTSDYVHIGNRLPAYCTSSGQAILAYHAQIAEQAAKELPSLTKNTITSPKAFLQKLSAVRKQGFAICDQEYRNGIVGMAVPVLNEKDVVIASLSLTAAAQRVRSSQTQKRYVALLAAASDRLTEMIRLRKRSG